MSIYEDVVPPMTQSLTNLERWLDLAVEYAESRKFDPAVLLTARLYPDQYALVRQVQAACDQAKGAAARLAGQEPPKHPDTETTLDELRARIATVKTFLAGFTPADFETAATRVIPLPFLQGQGMLATDYVRQMALPNFYFHLVHAYAILRHNGVPLGKVPFIGALNLRPL